jgi:hypothetical protein
MFDAGFFLHKKPAQGWLCVKLEAVECRSEAFTLPIAYAARSLSKFRKFSSLRGPT